MIIVVHQPMNDFFLRLTRSTYKTLFICTRLGEVLQTMSFAKSVPEGLKLSECKWGIGGKNLPIHFIPEKNPVQEALEKSKKTNYSSWCYLTQATPEQFVLHVRSTIYTCKQNGAWHKVLQDQRGCCKCNPISRDQERWVHASLQYGEKRPKGIQEKVHLPPSNP
jgi:hypothetical protein